MSIKIILKKNISDKIIQNYVLFVDDQYKINGLSKTQLSKYSKELNLSINANFDKKKNFSIFNIKPNQKILAVKIKKDQSTLKNEKIGAEFFNFVKSNSIFNFTLIEDNILETNTKNKFFLDALISSHKFRHKKLS